MEEGREEPRSGATQEQSRMNPGAAQLNEVACPEGPCVAPRGPPRLASIPYTSETAKHTY